MLFSTEKHLNGNTNDVLAHRLVVIQRVLKGTIPEPYMAVANGLLQRFR